MGLEFEPRASFANLDMRLPPLPDSTATRLAHAIADAVARAGGRTYLVGGCVRDRLLGIPVIDLDLEVYGVPPEGLVALLGTLGKVDEVGRDFGILKVSKEGAAVDVALPRTERKHGPGHRGFAVDADPFLDPAIAASRRDLTINAVMEDAITGELFDPWRGVDDAHDRVLRHVSPAFAEDPLRVLRVVQFAARFEFVLADETAALCRSLDLTELATERIAGEFEKWLTKARRPSAGLAAFVATGAHRLAPEIGFDGDDPREPDNARCIRELGSRLDRAAACRGGLPDPVAYLLAVLFVKNVDSITEAPHAAAIEARLALVSLGVTRQSLALAALKNWGEVRRLAREASSTLPAPAVRRLALRLPIAIAWRLLEADGESAAATRLRERSRELGVIDAPPAPWVLGRDLLASGAKPGKELGAMLDALFELQLDDRLADRDAALALAARWIASGHRDPP